MSSEQLEQRTEEILDRRAARLARRQTANSERRVDSTVAIVDIAGEKVGIPVSALREIIKRPPLVALPKLPPWLPGILQVRGEVLCAVDLVRWLGRSAAGQMSFVAVLEGQQGPVGLLTDGVLGFRDVFVDELAEELDTPSGERQRVVRAVTRDLVSLLDVDRLLADERIVVDHGLKVVG